VRDWLRRRRELAAEYWRIAAVEDDARQVVEELRRRRDGNPPERLDVPDLRKALNEVSDR
jgi:hypothetical protein